MKIYRRVMSHNTEECANFGKKLTLAFKNDIRNLVNFNVSSGKPKSLHFDVLLFSIVYKVLAKKVHRNYLSWHWKKIQPLKKNWLFVWKMTWEIWWILTRAVESLKVFTSMGYFCRKYIMFELKIQRSCVVKNDLWFQKWHK